MPSSEVLALKDKISGTEPLDLEIGAGVGFHALQYARQNPERQLIAIEHTREKYQKFERRWCNHLEQKGEPQNLIPVHANAISWVAYSLMPESVERIFLWYPNPEPKNKNKRWVNMPFMSCLLEVLQTGGELSMATNIESYALEAKEQMQSVWEMKPLGEKHLREGDITPRTHFEKKYLARGEVCWDLKWKKPTRWSAPNS